MPVPSCWISPLRICESRGTTVPPGARIEGRRGSSSRLRRAQADLAKPLAAISRQDAPICRRKWRPWSRPARRASTSHGEWYACSKLLDLPTPRMLEPWHNSSSWSADRRPLRSQYPIRARLPSAAARQARAATPGLPKMKENLVRAKPPPRRRAITRQIGSVKKLTRPCRRSTHRCSIRRAATSVSGVVFGVAAAWQEFARQSRLPLHRQDAKSPPAFSIPLPLPLRPRW